MENLRIEKISKRIKETYPSPKNQDPSRKENNTTNSRNCEGGSKKKKKATGSRSRWHGSGGSHLKRAKISQDNRFLSFSLPLTDFHQFRLEPPLSLSSRVDSGSKRRSTFVPFEPIVRNPLFLVLLRSSLISMQNGACVD